MTDLGQVLDGFSRQSRLYPALLACCPAIANAALMAPAGTATRLAALVPAVGAPFFLADLVRGRGQKVEAVLAERWGGLPTHRALWITDAENPVLTDRRRAVISALLGRPLPTRQLEQKNPTKARQEYDAAVRELLPRVRGKEVDPLLHGENIRYSFRRNAFGIRRWAAGLAGVAVVGDVLAVVADFRRTSAIAALIVALVCLVAWLAVPRDMWVKQAADSYRDRFFDALNRMTTAPQSN